MKPERGDFAGDSASTPALAETAACWVVRREAGLTLLEREELRRWLAADAAHEAAFAGADRARTELDWPLHAGVTDEVLAGLEQRAGRRRRRRSALGAAAVLLLAGWLWHEPWPARVQPESVTAAAGVVVLQPERRTLADGSVVELRDGAEITLDFNGAYRRVVLVNGEAHFSVVKNPSRPFVVQAGGVEVRAVGTAFSVGRGQTAVDVLVTEGVVAVEEPASAMALASGTRLLASLTAGHRIVVETGAEALPPAVKAVTAEEANEQLSWRVPRLEFSGTPLAEAIATINGYNRVQFMLADATLAGIRLSGVLRADRIDALVGMLEMDFGVRAERRDGLILLHSTR